MTCRLLSGIGSDVQADERLVVAGAGQGAMSLLLGAYSTIPVAGITPPARAIPLRTSSRMTG